MSNTPPRFSQEVVDNLKCDDDSDVEDEVDEEIWFVISEMRAVTEDHDNDGDNEEKLLVPRSSVPTDIQEAKQEQGSASTQGPWEQWCDWECGKHPSRGRSKSNLGDREKDKAYGWSYVAREVPRDRPVFQSPTGVNAPVDQNSSQYDCLQLFWTPNFWNLIKTETNRYAAQMKDILTRTGKLKKGTMLYNWQPVTTGELKHFFSIIIHMTLVQKESFDSYWSTNPILHTSFPTQVMKRNRFRAIYSCLHLNDNSNYKARGEENYDEFFKLRPYFDELCQLCTTYYLPNENLTIGEGTCAFRRRVHLKQKPYKYDMKIYMLCDSETGYALRMMPYVDNSKTVDEIVTSLLKLYFEKWHTVYMDQLLTNPTIFDKLWLNKTRAVGAVMLNQRGLPQEWRRQALEFNEMAFCHRENLTACKWKDKREVCFLTTKHAASWTEVEVKAKGGKIKRIKPDCVLDYNINKIRVDLNDQNLSHYNLHRKSMKGWKKMFFHLLVRSMINAYIIYTKINANATRMKFAHFLTQAGEDLSVDGGTEQLQKLSAGPRVSCPVSRLSGRHFMERIPPSEKKLVRSRACKVCADIGKKLTGKRGRKETVYYCPDCNVPLCVNPCFKLYHTKKDYTV